MHEGPHHTGGSQQQQINGSFQIKEELVFLNSALRVEELQEKQASDKDEKINDFFKSLSSIILPGFVKVKTRASGRMKPSLLHGSVS